MVCGVCAVALGQLQNFYNGRGGVDPITTLTRKLWTAPGAIAEKGANGARVWATKVWRVNQLEAENRAMRDQLRNLSQYQVQEDLLNQQLIESRDLLKLDLPGRTKVPCRIVSYSMGENRVRIDVGANQGVKPMQPVVTSAGLLGQVSTVEADSSDVTLLTSPNLKLTAIVEGRVKVVGLVHGETTRLVLEIQDVDTPLQAGNAVVTSGLTASYPKGLVIGDVTQVTDAKEFGVRRAYISPRARLEDATVAAVLQ